MNRRVRRTKKKEVKEKKGKVTRWSRICPRREERSWRRKWWAKQPTRLLWDKGSHIVTYVCLCRIKIGFSSILLWSQTNKWSPEKQKITIKDIVNKKVILLHEVNNQWTLSAFQTRTVLPPEKADISASEDIPANYSLDITLPIASLPSYKSFDSQRNAPQFSP